MLDTASDNAAAYERIAARTMEMSPRNREPPPRKFLTVDANAYTSLTQAQLAQLEVYSGPKSGTLSRSPIQAINRYGAESC